MMFMRKSAFRATASAFQLQQQQMEMGIFPFLLHFPCFLFLKHHHFLTSTSTKKPSLPKKNDGLVSNSSNNISIDDALASFYRMFGMNPRPSVVEFGKFLGSIAKKKQYSTVVSLCNQMDLFGVTHNVYSLNILINCLCRLNLVHFAVSVLGKMFKLGTIPEVDFSMENSDDEKDGVFGNCMPKELSISLTNGTKFVDEVLRGPSDRCLENFRMDKQAFYKLCDSLQGKGLLRHTNRIKIEEQLAIFLFIIGHNLRTRAVQELFRYSGETISRHFNNVLNAIMAISLDFFQPPGSDIPPEILEDPRFYPYFKDCVGAVDRIHIPVMVGIDEQGPFRNKNGQLSQNVLVACSFDLRFHYVLAGWEGSASDLRVLNSALTRRNKLQVPEGKYYLVDSKYANMPGFIAPYNGVLCHLNEFVGGYPPRDSRELFNQRHLLLRNVTDRIFGALKTRFPILMSAPPYPLQTQVKLVVAACALHNYIRREKPDDWIFKMHEHDNTLQMEESLPPLEVEPPIMQVESPALDIAFDTEQLEFSSQLRDSIAGDMWGDYISDLSTM